MRGTGVGLFFRLLLEPEHSQTRLPTGMGRSQVCECMNHDKKFHELSGIIDTWDSATEKPVHGKLVPGFGGRGRGQIPTRPTQHPIRLLFKTRGGGSGRDPPRGGRGYPLPTRGGLKKIGVQKISSLPGGSDLRKKYCTPFPPQIQQSPPLPKICNPYSQKCPGADNFGENRR